MALHKYAVVIVVLAVSSAGYCEEIPNGTLQAKTPASFVCPATDPRGEMYGNDALQTVLWPEGKIVFEPGGPGFVLRDGSLSMKWGWNRLRSGKLKIEGRRLDDDAPPLRSAIPDGYGDTGIQSSALIFPTPGCWEVTGRIADASLTFVTLVVKIGDGPTHEGDESRSNNRLQRSGE